MKKLWGGRFTKEEMDPDVLGFTSSLAVDKVLARYDCLATKAHVEMLAKCGYVSSDEKKELTGVLEDLASLIDRGAFCPAGDEDVHSAIQSYAESRAPVSAKKMHTARSRNEQVVNDVRLYCKEKAAQLICLIAGLQKALVEKAGKNPDVILPGYTHLNRAQPILLAHLFLAYVEMLERDSARLKDAAGRADISVMGSGAIAGSALKLDRKFTADRLGFASVSANSLDSVSDRDFMVELVSALAITAVHLSRISEDLILYSTPEFGFIDIAEEYCTGSSLMPQKKNPDVLELVRGRSAGVIGALSSLLILLKGIPHSYNRDLQEDKKFLFESVNTVADALAIMASVVSGIDIKKEASEKALEDEFIYATDIAEYLVTKGAAFSEAHRVVGSVVSYCSGKNINISDLSITELKGFSELLDEDVFSLLNAETSVCNKKTPGSTNPDMVNKEISAWKKKINLS